MYSYEGTVVIINSDSVIIKREKFIDHSCDEVLDGPGWTDVFEKDRYKFKLVGREYDPKQQPYTKEDI